jgi:hypothetical protein
MYKRSSLIQGSRIIVVVVQFRPDSYFAILILDLIQGILKVETKCGSVPSKYY